jgi:hypothetical protein
MGQPGFDQNHFEHAVVDVHGNYRSRRIYHEPPDELISDQVTPRVLRPHLVRSGFFAFLFVFVGVVSFFVWLLAVAAAIGNELATGGSGETGSFVGGVSYLLATIQFLVVVMWIVALFLPLREPIAEYGLLIEGRAAAHPVSYWWVMHTIQQRQSPFQVQLGKVSGLPVLLLVNGRERGLLTVRPVGQDLYVGWTMWRARSTVVMIGNLFRDMFQFHAAQLAADVRAANSRALRELIHSVTREGVQAAIMQPPVSYEVARSQIDALPTLDMPGAPMVTGAPQFQPQTHQHTQTGPQGWPQQTQQPGYQQYPPNAPHSGPPTQ